jgi:hypothetical protein
MYSATPFRSFDQLGLLEVRLGAVAALEVVPRQAMAVLQRRNVPPENPRIALG